MNFIVGPIFTSKHRQYICPCAYVIIICILGVAEGVIYETTHSRDLIEQQKTDLANLWTSYILPRLEEDLQNKHSNVQLQDDSQSLEMPFRDYDNTDNTQDSDSNSIFSTKIRRKRLGVAGLENLDLLTKTLDRARHRHRFHLPMSVNGMNTNRLRMLMVSQGKRK